MTSNACYEDTVQNILAGEHAPATYWTKRNRTERIFHTNGVQTNLTWQPFTDADETKSTSAVLVFYHISTRRHSPECLDFLFLLAASDHPLISASFDTHCINNTLYTTIKMFIKDAMPSFIQTCRASAPTWPSSGTFCFWERGSDDRVTAI
jgi:hypothetical protein